MQHHNPNLHQIALDKTFHVGNFFCLRYFQTVRKRGVSVLSDGRYYSHQTSSSSCMSAHLHKHRNCTHNLVPHLLALIPRLARSTLGQLQTTTRSFLFTSLSTGLPLGFWLAWLISCLILSRVLFILTTALSCDGPPWCVVVHILINANISKW